MRILFLHANIPNYPIEGLFHGLRQLLGDNVVDVPRYDVMYEDATPHLREVKTGNGGKILYGKLQDHPDLAEKRCQWQKELHHFDYILLADIDKMPGIFSQVYYRLEETQETNKLAIIDGYDTPSIYPFFNMRRKWRTQSWVFRLPIHRVKYFKREFSSYSKLVNLPRRMRWLESLISRRYPKLLPFSMSIPEEHIEEVKPTEKEQLMPQYLVDQEVAASLSSEASYNPVGGRDFAFDSEEGYLEDVRRSRFGVTTKRAGWDCLRHYEYAAKGTVLCFRDLDLKSGHCAPHGLSEENCVIYHSAADLNAKIDAMSVDEYARIQAATLQWVRTKTTTRVAADLLQQLQA